jgi:O-antigen ligase
MSHVYDGAMPAPTLSDRAPGLPVAILAWALFLVPAMGVPHELLLQDTLKSFIFVVGTFLAAVTYAFSCARGRMVKIQWHPAIAFPWVLAFYALASMAWSHPSTAAAEAIRWTVISMLAWLTFQLSQEGAVTKFAHAIHWGAVTACSWAALQFWWNFGPFPQFAYPASTFANRNFFAEFLVCALPYSVFSLLQVSRTQAAYFSGALLAAEVICLIMTGTRSALIALCVISPFVALVVWQQRYSLPLLLLPPRVLQRCVAAFAIVFLTLAFVPSENPSILSEGYGARPIDRVLHRASTLASPEEYRVGSFSVRTEMWKATIRMMMAHPLAGVGAGSWEIEIPNFQHTEDWLEPDFFPHNELLQLLSEYGLLVGGLSAATLLAVLTQVFSGFLARSKQPTDLAPFAFASVIALLIVSNAGFPMHLGATGMLLAVGIGLIAVPAGAGTVDLRSIPSELNNREAKISAWVGATLCAALLGLLLLLGRCAQAEYEVLSIIRNLNATGLSPSGLQSPGFDVNSVLHRIQPGLELNPRLRNHAGMVAEKLVELGYLAQGTAIAEQIVSTRPNVPSVRAGLALSYSKLGLHAQARAQYEALTLLRPDAQRIKVIELVLLINEGDLRQAAIKLSSYFDSGKYSAAMVELAMLVGNQTNDQALLHQAGLAATKVQVEKK